RDRPGDRAEATRAVRRDAVGAGVIGCLPRDPRRRPAAVVGGAAVIAVLASALGDPGFPRALLACVAVGAFAPTIGAFLVQKRLSLIGHRGGNGRVAAG